MFGNLLPVRQRAWSARMSTSVSQEYLNGLVAELRKLPSETAWIEFKVNNADPEEVGEYLSALSNAAALYGKANAYLVWAVKMKLTK